MADFVQCPQCALKHSRRDDGLCPRCHNAVPAHGAAEVAAPAPAPSAPVVEQLRVRETEAPGVVTAGTRAAGILLLVNATMNVASVALMPGDVGAINPLHGIVADLAVGIALVTGRQKWHRWAYVRAVVGGLLFGGIFAAQGNWLAVVFQLMLSSSLVLLLAGQPSKLRLGAAVALCAPYFLLAAFGLVASKTGLGAAALAARGEIEAASGTVRGTQFPYCIDVPARNWYLRSEAAAHRDNPLSDRWLTRPELDAHVMIIGEEASGGGTISQARYEEALAGDAKSRQKQRRHLEPQVGIDRHHRVLGQEPPRALAARGRLARILAGDRDVAAAPPRVRRRRGEEEGAAPPAGEQEPPVGGEKGRARFLSGALGDLAHRRDRLGQGGGRRFHVRVLEVAAAAHPGEEDQEAALAVGLAAQARSQRGVDRGLQRPPCALPVGDRTVVREQPGSVLEGMRVLRGHPPDAGLADVGQYGLGCDEVGQLLEICVAVGGCETADHPRDVALVPADAPAVGMLAALHPQGVGAVEELVGNAAPVAGAAAEEAAHARQSSAPPSHASRESHGGMTPRKSRCHAPLRSRAGPRPFTTG